MISFSNVWGIARAEMRLTRRIVRFWVFSVLAALFAGLVYFQLWAIHFFFSAGSASAASAYPRFFMGAFGSNFLFIMMFGLVFLGFDLRARDTRERMAEVLDSLPYSNIELVFGKFLGVLIPSWIAVLVTTGLLTAGSMIGKAPIEPWSMINFGIFMSLPAYTFALGMVFLLASVVRHRLLVSLLALAALLSVWAAMQWLLPMYASPILDITGGLTVPFGSDIISSIMALAGVAQRVGILLAGIGLLLLAVATHPRDDDGSRRARAGVAIVLVVLGFGIGGWQVLENKGDIDQALAWKELHEQRDAGQAPDVLAVTGTVGVNPGRSLDMDLRLRFRPQPGQALDEALFSLNPGLDLAAVTDEGGNPLEFFHEDGFMTVRLPRKLVDGAEQSIDVSISGLPDANFAYLDSAVIPFELKAADAQLLILGYEPYLYDANFLALAPGVRWMPASGSEVGRGDPKARPKDFFDLDLTVEVPEGWLVAGPGRRQGASGAGQSRTRFRFAPGAPVPEVALVAGRYESRTVDLDGVLLEMLVHPSHAEVFDEFVDAADELTEWLGLKLEEAGEVGLDYPYDGLTMVEVPNALRGYGGGWRMDSTLIQPAMILMRESGFPTARFRRAWRNPSQYEDREGGLPRRKRETLERFFENDMSGGNPFVAVARSFFGYQTSGAGPAGLPLDFVFENLCSRLVTEHRGYFSYRLFDRDFGQDFQRAGQQMGNADRVGNTYADVLIHQLTSRPEVWDAVLDVSLAEMDPWKNPEMTIDILALKGGAMAQSMLDDLGREKTGRFLSTLRSENRGETFDREDILSAAEAVEEDLETWMDTWLEQTDLPGFVVGDVRVHRVRDADDGTPRYQSLVTLRNEETVPGLVKLEYRKGSGIARTDRGASDPVRVAGSSAVEIGLITSEVPTALRVTPYLALNRDPFNLQLPTVDEEELSDDEPFIGSRPVEWTPEAEGVVVDDLDELFAIEGREGREMLRVVGRGGEEVLDQGLPVTGRLRSKRWSRMSATSAYGKYRHTMAVIEAGTGEHTAVFKAELSDAGRWELEYYFAQPQTRSAKRLSLGVFKLKLVDESGSQEMTFDAGGGESGWNSLGTFEIAGGEVRVEVSNETDGDYVVADAIRWTAARGSGQLASR